MWKMGPLDLTIPTAEIISPVSGDVVNGVVPILVNASDSLSGVDAVQFYAGYSDTAGASMQGMPQPPAPAEINQNGEVIATDVITPEYGRRLVGTTMAAMAKARWDACHKQEQSGGTVWGLCMTEQELSGAAQWDISVFRPPVNDDFGTPIQITTNSYANQQNTYNATSALDDPALTDCYRAPGNAAGLVPIHTSRAMAY